VLKVGDAVAVTYRDASPSPHALLIRALPALNTESTKAAEMQSSGTVKEMGADSITIRGNSGGGGSFTQTFVIGSDTTIVGKGAGTAAAANGGRVAFAKVIANGDRVSVSYHQVGSELRASDVRVLQKRSGSN
jgi:hypothetical protein